MNNLTKIILINMFKPERFKVKKFLKQTKGVKPPSLIKKKDNIGPASSWEVYAS